MDLTEKIAYLKGLMEGMEIDKNSKEGKIYAAIMDVLTDMALTMEDMTEYVDELAAQVDEIDEDLAEVEEYLCDDDCDCDCDCDDDCDCGCHDDWDDEWDGEFYEVTCPACGETFDVDEETLLDGGIACPECNEPLEFEIECDDCDCDDDCDCGCHDDEE